MDCKSNEYRIHIIEPCGSEKVITGDGYVVILDHGTNIDVEIRNMGRINFILALKEILSEYDMKDLLRQSD